MSEEVLARVMRHRDVYVLKIANIIFARQGDKCVHVPNKQWSLARMRHVAREINATVGCSKRTFTTTEVSNILHVSAQTVVRWCNGDKLQCSRLPESRARRISISSLKEFMDEYGFPKTLLE